MDKEKIEAVFHRLHEWKKTVSNGWAGSAVAGRFEAGARGEIPSELLTIGPELTQRPAAKELANVLARLNMPDASLLDFGCANGIYGELLSAIDFTKRWQYIGVDVNPLMIDSCRSRFPDRIFKVVEDGKPIPVADGEVDIVLASGVMECIEDTEFALRDFSRVARSFVILYRIPCRPVKPVAIYQQLVRHAWGSEEHVFRVFNQTDLEKMIDDAGLEIVSREVSSASGVWTPPDDPEPVEHFLYLLKKK